MKRVARSIKSTIDTLVFHAGPWAIICKDLQDQLWYGALLCLEIPNCGRVEKWFYFAVTEDEAKELNELFEKGFHSIEAPFRRKLASAEVLFVREDWRFAGRHPVPACDTIGIDTFELTKEEMIAELKQLDLRYAEPDHLPDPNFN